MTPRHDAWSEDMDEEARRRFHDHANRLHDLTARVGVTESKLEAFEELVEEKLDRIRGDFTPVKNAVYTFIALIVVAFVGALITGVFK